MQHKEWEDVYQRILDLHDVNILQGICVEYHGYHITHEKICFNNKKITIYIYTSDERYGVDLKQTIRALHNISTPWNQLLERIAPKCTKAAKID